MLFAACNEHLQSEIRSLLALNPAHKENRKRRGYTCVIYCRPTVQTIAARPSNASRTAAVAVSGQVCLDEGGRQMTSPAFSDFLFSKLEEGGSRLTFVVGGAEGLPPGLKNNLPKAGAKLSLSRMTFTHLWARALLAEQIYRASEIRRGSKYHKE